MEQGIAWNRNPTDFCRVSPAGHDAVAVGIGNVRGRMDFSVSGSPNRRKQASVFSGSDLSVGRTDLGRQGDLGVPDRNAARGGSANRTRQEVLKH